MFKPNENAFIEIYNATEATVDLTNYYLSDDEDYALTPGLFGAGPAPNIASSDFIVQFPHGAMINHRQVVVIALNGAGFDTLFGFKADFEIKGNDPSTPDMIPIEIDPSSRFTIFGENICIFYWDGASDLVADVDMVNIGRPGPDDDIGNKTGVSVDGPDANSIATPYLDDAWTMPLQISHPSDSFSTKREWFEDDNELRPVGGGNGITGHDETTENILITWDTMFVAPDPGVVGPDVPVELSFFTASVNRNSVTLNWATATEINNLGFEIERKQGNNTWVRIGFKEGHGTTTELKNYQFIDDISSITANSLAYRLKQIDFDGSYEYSDEVFVNNPAPVEYALHQNFPNPYNPVTTVTYSLPIKSQVELVVYNILGESVTQLVNEEQVAGQHSVEFNSTSLPSGIYFYKLQVYSANGGASSYVETKKMVLMK
jgi:hypothetical protein